MALNLSLSTTQCYSTGTTSTPLTELKNAQNNRCSSTLLSQSIPNYLLHSMAHKTISNIDHITYSNGMTCVLNRTQHNIDSNLKNLVMENTNQFDHFISKFTIQQK